MISFDKTICGNLEAALSREWLETNGLGGFACGTIAGANTRRYHGLLTAALNPPGGRMLLLSKMEETLVLGERRIDFSTNEYDAASANESTSANKSTIHPEGYLYLSSFRLDPFPIFIYDVAGIKLEKSLFMLNGSNTVQIEYRLLESPAGSKPQLELRPLIAFRDYHSTAHENVALNPQIQGETNLVSVQPYNSLPRLYFAHNAKAVAPEGYWYRNFLYRLERERGLDATEDLFNPLVLRWNLNKDQAATVIASTEPRDIGSAAQFRSQELKRREALKASAPNQNPFVQALTVAANQFLVRRGDGWTVIAGYPWFTDWGRDTMISLPGLTLFTGNAEIAKGILRNFAQHVDQGMLPNRFVDSGETAEFNTVDATLWFFEAARAYAAATGDYKFVREELYPVFTSIIDFHIKGTRYNIKVAENGLLNAGAPGTQLTWMDAKVGDWVVTPRSGQPVEIQALWYNALKIMEELAQRFGDEDLRQRYCEIASKTFSSFNQLFWNSEKNCLYDLLNNGNGVPDASLRPNQIFAASLHYSMLSQDRARGVVETVERDLLTPVGLRTLAPSDPHYCPHYEGDQRSRDSAYHQGTVWPWLLGPFITAYVRVNGGSAAAREHAHSLVGGLETHLTEAGLGQISEIFDGDAPHLPRGCFAQAWSVAEILRALCQDVYQLSPAAQPPGSGKS
ncbi:MAG TPA: amylo-alpha-1,6-glucosidase [Candidatus Angelobacter sp.]|nr:amylo-alpha-1,6-glucosidase [Candidatus Angelobacter sp.]